MYIRFKLTAIQAHAHTELMSTGFESIAKKISSYQGEECLLTSSRLDQTGSLGSALGHVDHRRTDSQRKRYTREGGLFLVAHDESHRVGAGLAHTVANRIGPVLAIGDRLLGQRNPSSALLLQKNVESFAAASPLVAKAIIGTHRARALLTGDHVTMEGTRELITDHALGRVALGRTNMHLEGTLSQFDTAHKHRHQIGSCLFYYYSHLGHTCF
mmetsp:Transcript_11219/g.34417  ORF Transcript_11219/g.34417 Transcript_11219/m.34417 type:complete len:214 (+) Transcript_11219:2486-3127(+)